jgi:hypothetical protein
MPRKLRVEYPGAIYHVMSRANGKGNVFERDVDRHDFLKTLAECCEKAGFEVHAYCLMRNHFHLVVEMWRSALFTGLFSRWIPVITGTFIAVHRRDCGAVGCGGFCHLLRGLSGKMKWWGFPSLPQCRFEVTQAFQGTLAAAFLLGGSQGWR